jgi:DNA-binding protein H-NS
MSDQTTAVRSLQEIDKELDALQQERALALKNETKEALVQVKQIIAKFGFTADQVFRETKVRAHAAAKFLNPETGETWSGRGREPRWIKGKNVEQFRIKDSDRS